MDCNRIRRHVTRRWDEDEINSESFGGNEDSGAGVCEEKKRKLSCIEKIPEVEPPTRPLRHPSPIIDFESRALPSSGAVTLITEVFSLTKFLVRTLRYADSQMRGGEKRSENLDLSLSVPPSFHPNGGYMGDQTFHTPSFGDEEFDIPPINPHQAPSHAHAQSHAPSHAPPAPMSAYQPQRWRWRRRAGRVPLVARSAERVRLPPAVAAGAAAAVAAAAETAEEPSCLRGARARSQPAVFPRPSRRSLAARRSPPLACPPERSPARSFSLWKSALQRHCRARHLDDNDVDDVAVCASVGSPAQCT
ncbi:Protein of unknown function [Gryllus bimaculatus]|nr:Protein of unknown function [Gryllus bimaculatus]